MLYDFHHRLSVIIDSIELKSRLLGCAVQHRQSVDSRVGPDPGGGVESVISTNKALWAGVRCKNNRPGTLRRRIKIQFLRPLKLVLLSRKNQRSSVSLRRWGQLFPILSPLFISVVAMAMVPAEHPNRAVLVESGFAQSPRVSPVGISANPGAVNLFTGTGALGESLGIKESSGVRLGGIYLADADYLISGGLKPQHWSGNSLLILSASLDAEVAWEWKGALFGVEFLQFNGMNTNGQAGSVQGYNSLPGAPPLNRSELYQLWYRQQLFRDRLTVRIGKTVPTDDFNNVLLPVPTVDRTLAIPSVSGLIYTPIFVNTTMLGVLPGYYNSAYGITANLAFTQSSYLSYGIYDGNGARGVQTGLTGPHFNGYYFQIAEAGCAWQAGEQKKPGLIAVGAWSQSGELSAYGKPCACAPAEPTPCKCPPEPPVGPKICQNGAQGLYAFGSQRLWLRHPDVDDSGISGFFQLGINHSKTLPMQRYVGLGFTAFGLGRSSDMMGVGMAWSKLNPKLFDRPSELMFQAYYQGKIFSTVYVEPVLTYIPTPGAGADLPAAWAATVRLMVLF